MTIKHLFMVLLLGCMTISLSAQHKGKKLINLGVGYDSNQFPLYLTGEYYFTHEITAGIEGNWRRFNSWKKDNKKYHQDLIVTSFIANYHFAGNLGLFPDIDLYAGVSIGYFNWVDNVDYASWTNQHTDVPGLGGQVGFRYEFVDNLHFNLEVRRGKPVSNSKLGLSYRFD